MSTKDLFERNYLPDNTEKTATSEIESVDNLKALSEKQQTFVPQVDYSDPQTFAKYGSAYMYYESAIQRILDFYPYDGSDAEINNFYNKSLDIEKYIFNNRYPRTNGYVVLSSGEWGAGSKTNDNYGIPATKEYITFTGGPNVVSQTGDLKNLAPDSSNSKFQYNNVYDENVYTNDGLPSDYGEGTRTSNLKSNFDTGVTVEFWAKTGSLDTSLSEKQVILDVWNNAVSSSDDYGRITIELNATASNSPWMVTVQSGSGEGVIFQKVVGTNVTLNSLEDWKHYAFTLSNTGSNFQIELYVDGELDDTETIASTTINELNPRDMRGRIGGLLTAPSGSAIAGVLPSAYIGGGKLSGSLDEFRFWKVRRSAKEIGRNWFTQVRGGVNTDIANTTLGMYYKFNEGITQTASVDSVVLDYGGRICNGTWTGYASTGRNTGSAIVSASAAASEYLDPIIYTTHTDVAALRTELLNLGAYHDGQNTGRFLNLIPSWVIEETAEQDDSDLEKLSHIIGAYFDKLYLQISALPKFKHLNYPSSSHTPLPFAEHLPASLGLMTPEIFIDSTVAEKFANRTDTTIFENELQETKNLIYQNIYNNISSIFKAKGTERAIRNVLRCFNIDDNLVYLNAYANNQTFELQNNLVQTQKRRRQLNFNELNSTTATVFQSADPAFSDSVGFISGSGTDGYEDKYGFTLETSVMFPKFIKVNDPVGRSFTDVSLFGMQTAFTSSDATGYAGGTTSLTGAQDVANFQVFAIRDEAGSKNVHFKLTSSFNPHPFGSLTSSLFQNVYDNQNWNFSVALRPSNFPFTDVVSGSDDYTYDVIFRGYNNKLGTIDNQFEVSSSVTKAVGQAMLRAAKRTYLGAQNTNMTGSNLAKSDILVNSSKYWTKFVDSYTLKNHALDRENHGISGSYRNINALDALTSNQNSYNFNTLAMNLYFNNITSSDSGGNFFVTDLSSGSAATRNNFGWAGQIAGYLHTAKGHGFPASSTKVAPQRIVSEFKFVEPEQVVSSDMVKVLSDDDELFGLFDEVPNYVFTIEKSLYKAISEEILDFFAGVIDFNSIIGDPVHRYRMEYKPINHLRNVFFQRFKDINTVEKFTEYFKWFDDALANIIEQLVPASSDLVPDVYNTIESHVLERNKYQNQFPTIEFKQSVPGDVGGTGLMNIEGIGSKGDSFSVDSFGGVSSSPRPTNVHKNFWKKKARPGPIGSGYDFEISSGDALVDAARRKLKDIMWAKPVASGTMPVLSTVDGTRYIKNPSVASLRGGTFEIKEASIDKTIKGGVNFEHQKDIDYTYTSLRPMGPINHSGGVHVPQNVLLAHTEDLNPIDSLEQFNQEGFPGQKRLRHLKVIQGRDYYDGSEYTVNKNSFAFPFNVMSASIVGGVDKLIRERTEDNLSITNLHNDVYGSEMEKPMQGPYTDFHVGGHQSRHIPLNISASNKSYLQLVDYKGLDDYTSRPEAWKIVLGKCGGEIAGSGAIGMVGPDYPWPEANNVGAPPYPMTASQKAYLYRDFIAKRPVNIKNIKQNTTGGRSTLGNYKKSYEIVQTFGAFENPRNFVENQPVLPTEVFQNNTSGATQTRTALDIRRNDESHFQFVSEYSINYLTKSTDESVITTRFSAPGGIEVNTAGYNDFRANEYSVYNNLTHRNSAVIRRSQVSTGSISEATGSGTTGIRVSDIHGRDFGLTSHYSRHTARFGRDSNLVDDTAAGALYVQSPGFHKTHRNDLDRVEVLTESLEPVLSGATLINTEALYFGDQTNKGFMLINADSSSAQTFLTSSRTSGFSYSGWIRFSPDDDTGYILSAGNCSAGSDSFINILKDQQTSQERLYLWVRTRASNPSGTSTLAKFYAATNAVDDGNFHHFVVTVPSDGLGRIGSAVGMYVDGSPVTVVTQSAPAEFFDTTGKVGTYNVRSKVTRTADTALTLGGGSSETGTGAGTDSPFSGSMDQVSLWLGTLSATDVSELYNGGIPCDVTSSSPYASADTELFAWYRFGSGSANDAIGTNSGTFISGTNSIFNWDPSNSRNLFPVGYTGTAFSSNLTMSATEHPTPLAGCTPQVVGFKTVRTFHTASQFDNFFIQHQIPRATTQYNWITKSVVNIHNELGFVSPDFTRRVSSSTGITYEDSYDFVSASQVGSSIDSGNRIFGKEQGQTGFEQFMPQVSRLNLNIVDPLSASTNTMGHATTIPLGSTTETDTQYINAPEFIDTVDQSSIPDAFNMLMIKRNGYYGNAGWQQARRQDHQLLTNERKNNKLSVEYRNGDRREYNLLPVSAKGMPVHVNLDFINMLSTSAGGIQRNVENATFKTSYNNEMVLFHDRELNDFVEVNYDSEVTAFEQMVAMKDRSNFNLNWILYSENVFPSTKNEFLTKTTERLNYDNEFWRDTQDARIVLGTGKPNSLGITGSIGNPNNTQVVFTSSSLSQSSWPLDAPSDFETRTAPPVISIAAGGTGLPTLDSPRSDSLVVSNSAGELQNTYSTYWFANSASFSRGSFTTAQLRGLAMTVRPAALYSRKHMLMSKLSTKVQAYPRSAFGPNKLETADSIATGSGEAKWQAAEQAGFFTQSNGVTSFVSKQSKPFYNDYDSFKQDIKTLAKGYGVVPEFRISERIEDYTKFGLRDGEVFNTFDIPGTEFSSSQDSFYKDFSNSDFLRNFADIKKMSDLSAKEIKLTCHAAIKFNPYKGFYPVQRSIDIVSQFSKSYGNSVEVALNQSFANPNLNPNISLRTLEEGNKMGDSPFQSAFARPLYAPLFAPGILYNSIKAGMAVDYPILTYGDNFTAQNITGAFVTPHSENFLVASANNSIGDTAYVSGAYWDVRLPFETIMDPASTMKGLTIPEQEPHPSQSLAFNFGYSASIGAAPSDNTYTMMASNYFAEIGKFFLRESGFTRLESNGVNLSTFKFEEGEVYGARLRMKRSY
ncbi:MAG: hypothetical protein CMC82_01025, partial [Flavobacteriaceae bacterium]|nr:hypothetical protein [Flavobacteriaceae bacterium]